MRKKYVIIQKKIAGTTFKFYEIIKIKNNNEEFRRRSNKYFIVCEINYEEISSIKIFCFAPKIINKRKLTLKLTLFGYQS